MAGELVDMPGALGGDLACRKRHLEAEALTVFGRWCYPEITTPLVESCDVLERGAGEQVLARTFKFLGPDGRLMALRPDVTTPVARLVAGSGVDLSEPMRVSYVGPVYRRTDRGTVAEQYQAGAELIGVPGASGDAEIIEMASELMAAMGVVDWQIGIGHVGLLDGVCRELRLTDTETRRVREAIASGNLVALEGVLRDVPGCAARSLLTGSFALSDPSTVLGELEREIGDDEAQAAIANLNEVFTLLGSRCGRVPAALDPGVVRDFDYYTGLVFAVYVAGAGHAVGGGGRYDDLLRRYGTSSPATGFAVCISDLLQVGCGRQSLGWAMTGIH